MNRHLQMRALLKQEAASLGQRSASICEQVRKRTAWNNFQTVGLYSPLAEANRTCFHSWASDRRYVLPGSWGRSLVWHPVLDVKELQTGSTGGLQHLRELSVAQEVHLHEIDCHRRTRAGVCCEDGGAALRRGGCTTAVLVALGPNTVTIGVCFEFQLLETLPMEVHDISVQRSVSGLSFPNRSRRGRPAERRGRPSF
jgi:5-formyltetrahydrofolate cyclo-ligase